MSKFDQLAAELAQRKGITDPRGLAYAIGRKKYGKRTMGQAAAKGVSAAYIARKKQG